MRFVCPGRWPTCVKLVIAFRFVMFFFPAREYTCEGLGRQRFYFVVGCRCNRFTDFLNILFVIYFSCRADPTRFGFMSRRVHVDLHDVKANGGCRGHQGCPR